MVTENSSVTAKAAATEPKTQSQVPPTTQDQTAPPPPDHANQTVKWQEMVANVDPTEVLEYLGQSKKLDQDTINKSRTFAGIVGSVAERVAAKKVQEQTERLLQEQEQRELKKLREEDPHLFAQKHAELEQKRAEQEKQRQEFENLVRGNLSTVQESIAQFAEVLPEDVRNKFAGKQYEGSYFDGVAQYLREVSAETDRYLKNMNKSVTEMVKTELSKMLPSVRESVRKELAGERDANEPPIDDGNATQDNEGGNTEFITQVVWEANRSNKDWRKANRELINKSLRSGQIRG